MVEGLMFLMALKLACDTDDIWPEGLSSILFALVCWSRSATPYKE